MLRLALTDFGVESASWRRADMLEALNGFLRRCAEEDTIAALIVDEAQNLDDDTFEDIRLLSNFETLSAKLLQIILVGQQELEFKLRRPSLRQVAERVALRCHLEPLSRKESGAYLDHRLRKVNAQPDLFAASARRMNQRAARGIPRRINILCDNALLFAFGRNEPHVSRAAARLAVRERAKLLTPPLLLRRLRTFGALWSSAFAATLLLVATAAAMHWWRDRPMQVVAPIDAAASISDIPDASTASHSQRDAARTSIHAEAYAASQPPDDVALDGPEAGGEPARPPSGADVPVAEPDPLLNAAAHGEAANLDAVAEAPVPSGENGAPAFRTVRVRAGSTLSSLTKEVYGLADPHLIARIQSANPHVVDPDRILAGDTLRFPAAGPQPDQPAEERP
jgi:general secretion pathway protein A